MQWQLAKYGDRHEYYRFCRQQAVIHVHMHYLPAIIRQTTKKSCAHCSLTGYGELMYQRALQATLAELHNLVVGAHIVKTAQVITIEI